MNDGEIRKDGLEKTALFLLNMILARSILVLNGSR